MNGSGEPKNMPEWNVEHLKSEVRGTTWCGVRYDVGISRQTPRSGKPLCDECRAIDNDEVPPKAPTPLFGR